MSTDIFKSVVRSKLSHCIIFIKNNILIDYRDSFFQQYWYNIFKPIKNSLISYNSVIRGLNFRHVPIHNLRPIPRRNKKLAGVPCQFPRRKFPPWLDRFRKMESSFSVSRNFLTATFRWHSLSAHSFPPTCLSTYMKHRKCARYMRMLRCTHTYIISPLYYTWVSMQRKVMFTLGILHDSLLKSIIRYFNEKYCII